MENIEILNGYDGSWLVADGFDNAIIGTYDTKVVYSSKKCVDILISEGMSETEAIEYFDFNVVGSYMGEKTPIFIDDYDFIEENHP